MANPVLAVTERRREPPLNLALVAFPLLVSVRLSPKIELGCLGLLVLLSLRGKSRPGESLRRYLPLVPLVGVCAGLSLLRGAPLHEVVTLGAVTLAVVLIGQRVQGEVAVRSLVVGMVGYLLGNIAGWLVGLQSPAASVRVGLYENSASLLGVRILFPFTRSINEPAIVAAAVLAFVLVSWRRGRRVGPLLWVGSLAALFMIDASGSRFPVIVLALIIPWVLLLPRLARLVPTLAVISIGTPYFVTAIGGLRDWLAGQIAGVAFLARGQSAADIAGGSSRQYFWERGLSFWGRVVDLPHQMIGYGYNGHVESQVVYTYYQAGGFVSNPTALTLHNSFLQQMYDTGYVGLAALIVGLLMVGRRATATGNLPLAALLGVLFMTAMVEVFLDPSFRAIPFMLVLALAGVLPPGSESREAAGDESEARATQDQGVPIPNRRREDRRRDASAEVDTSSGYDG